MSPVLSVIYRKNDRMDKLVTIINSKIRPIQLIFPDDLSDGDLSGISTVLNESSFEVSGPSAFVCHFSSLSTCYNKTIDEKKLFSITLL